MAETETPESLPTYDPYLGGNISQAVNDLAWLGNRFRGLTKVSESAKDILSLLRNEDELRARLTALEAREADLKVILAGTEAAQARLDNLGAEISAHLAASDEAAKAVAAEIVAAAETKAGAIVASAERAAVEVSSQRTAEDEVVISERSARIGDLNQSIVRLETTLAAREESLRQAEAAIAAIRARVS